MLGLFGDEPFVVEIVDFHGALHVVECLRGHLPGCLRTGAENLVDLFDAAFVVFAAFAERLQRLVEHGDQEFLDLHVAQAAAAVMRLQLVQRRVVGQIFREMLGAAEGIDAGGRDRYTFP